MEVEEDEGEGFEHLFQGGDEKPFTDFLHRTDHLALSDFVDSIDVVDPLLLVLIALMDRVDADIARLTPRAGSCAVPRSSMPWAESSRRYAAAGYRWWTCADCTGGSRRCRPASGIPSVSYTHLRAHETDSYLVCRLLLEKKK